MKFNMTGITFAVFIISKQIQQIPKKIKRPHYASPFLLIYSSFFLLFSNFLHFLISIHFMCVRNIANFPTFRFL